MIPYAHPEALVDTQWLSDHLHDPTLRILEVDMSPEPYQNNHIPGAVFWNILKDVFQPDLRINFEPDAIASLLSRSGIANETTVIAYGSYPGTGAWIFWFLNVIGHQNVRVLNGGHQKWLAEGRPVASKFATVSPRSHQPRLLNMDLRATKDEVLAAINDPQRVLLDVRTLPEYVGEVFLMEPPKNGERAGHIPGAVHLEHTLTLNEDGTFKSVEELQTLFSSQGIAPEKEVFPYCAVGGRSAYMWFVLKHLLGYANVRNYDGSWNEWSRLADTPIA
ncbi:sulfurtransferase [Nodosilinea nodulosa]|uniref:sulfurtransferase n=1 Tax=Nodosilinea nodulosa TaxID=416001 RepID=UPI0002E32619|nr:rhodanese-like domain-containing protein [Nodosilinea nodulosa]